MLAAAYLVLFLLSGYRLMCWQFPRKTPIERAVVGAGIGLALLMWLPALCAYVLKFTREAHVASLVLLLAVLAVGYFSRDKESDLRGWSEDQTRLLRAMLVFVVPFTLLGGYMQYTHVILEAADGSYWVGQATYGDLNLHLGITTSLRNASFPPNYSLLSGATLSYPYLADSLSTSFMILGVPLRGAIAIPATLMMAMVYSSFFLLAYKLLGGGRYKLAILASLLFFVNGGFGFLYDIDRIGADPSRFLEIFTGFYTTPANQPSLNLRWSNIIADMLVPQRTLLGGWAVLIPTLYMLLDAAGEKRLRGFVWVGLMAGSLPLLHTHSFLALGLFSAGFLGCLLIQSKDKKRLLQLSAVYLAITLVLALPQLIDFAFKQTLEGNVLRVQFNWVNNSNNAGMIDGYFFFWIKNVGPPFVLLLCALLDVKKRGKLPIISGALAIFVVAELVLFQRNEYDNNKLFYVFYMFAVVIAADYAWVIWKRLEGLRGRVLLAALFISCSLLSGGLSIARECVSTYQLFGADAVRAAKFIQEHTPAHSTFMTGQSHVNAVSALTGRNIVCGPSNYLFFHGLSYTTETLDCQRFYVDPMNNLDVLEKYDVDYIYVGAYERSDFAPDMDALNENFEKIYNDGAVCIYLVGE